MWEKYKNSPIVEAFCGFQFNDEENLSFDLVKFNAFYTKIKNDFPGYEKINMHPINNGDTMCIDGMQFSRNDNKNMLLKATPILLSINILQPYVGWEVFFPVIKDIFKKYYNVFKVKKITKIILGYLNEIHIKSKIVKIQDYFNFYPSIGSNLPQKNDMFSVELFIPYKKQNGILNIELNKIPHKREHVYLLELNYSSTKRAFNKKNFDDVFNWIETAHTNIEDAFEGCITPKLRNIFNEVVGE